MHREIFKRNFGEIPKGYHIHHLDGNRKNNDPDNLIAVSPQMHYEIHLALYNRYGRYQDAYAVNRLSHEISKPRVSGFKGKPLSLESQAKAADTLKKRYSSGEIQVWNKGLKNAQEPYWLGKKRPSPSDKTKKLMSEKMKGRKLTWLAKEVTINGVRYESVSEAARVLGKSRRTIGRLVQ